MSQIILHVVVRASSVSRGLQVRQIERHLRGRDRLGDYLLGTLQEQISMDLAMNDLPDIDNKRYAGS